jgi:hypothetical protein
MDASVLDVIALSSPMEPKQGEVGFVAGVGRTATFQRVGLDGRTLSENTLFELDPSKAPWSADSVFTETPIGLGDVWVGTLTGLVRISAGVQVASITHSVLVNGMLTNGFVGADCSVRSTTFDGVERWATPIGPCAQGGDLAPFISARASVGADGAIYVGCNLCEMGQRGLARVDPQTGAAQLIVKVPDPSAASDTSQYGAPVIMGDTIVALTYLTGGPFPFGWLSFDPQAGGQVIPGRGSPIVGEDGLVYYDAATKHIVWGSRSIDVTTLKAPDGHSLANSQPIAVVRPSGLLVLYSPGDWQALLQPYELASTTRDAGLALIDPSGAVIWQFHGVAPSKSRPVVANGVIVLVDADAHLRFVSAPVQGLAQTAWPVVGHDRANTFNAATPIP